MQRFLPAVGLSLLFWAAIIIAAMALMPTRALALSSSLGTIRVFTFTCGTNALNVIPSSGRKGSKFQHFWNNSATPVFLGGSDVNTSTLGYPICTNTALCEGPSIRVESAPVVYCKAGSSVDIIVISGM